MQRKIAQHNKLNRNKKSFSSSFRAPKKEKSYNKLLVILFIPLFLFIITIIFIFSNFFNIKSIDIIGLDNEKSLEIESIALEQKNSRKLLFKQDNLIFFNTSDLNNSLSGFNFSEIKIKKDYFKAKITINIKKRDRSAIFLESSNYFFIDNEANIIESFIDCDYLQKLKEESEQNTSTEDTSINDGAADVNDQNLENFATNNTNNEHNFNENINEGLINLNEKCLKIDQEFKSDNLLPLIENHGKDKLNSDKKRLGVDKDYLDFSLKLYNDLSENTEFGFKNIILDEEYNTVKVRLNNDLELYFSFKNDYLEQISRFFTLKRERINDLKGKKYIDFRYGDKIYYY